MVTRINGLLFYTWDTKKLYALGDDELKLAWCLDNIKHYTEYFKRKNEGTAKEKWKMERKSYKKKLKARLKLRDELLENSPHLFL